MTTFLKFCLLSDLNIDHAAYYLFLFHESDANAKKAIVAETANTLVRVYEYTTTEKGSNYSPLLLSRLLVLFDYLVHFYDKPSPLLVKMIEISLFNSASDEAQASANNPNTLAVSSSSSIVNASDESQLARGFARLKSLDKLIKSSGGSKARNKVSLLVRPCFYSFSSTNLNTLLTTDDAERHPIAKPVVSDILQAKDVDYNRLSEALLGVLDLSSNLVKTSGRPKSTTGLADHDYVSISYAFLVAWQLLEPCFFTTKEVKTLPGLPPSEKFLSETLRNISQDQRSSYVQIQSLRVLSHLQGRGDLATQHQLVNDAALTKESSVAFFIDLWSRLLKQEFESVDNLENSDNITAPSSDHGALKTPINVNRLFDLNKLFSYHLNLVSNSLARTDDDEQPAAKLVHFLVKLIYLYKYIYKRHLILDKHQERHAVSEEPGADSKYVNMGF